MGELPNAVGIINSSYGPAFYLANKAEISNPGFRKLIDQKNFTLHGLMEAEEGKTMAWNLSDLEYNTLKFDAQLQARIKDCMKRVGKTTPIEAMKQQIYRHGIYFRFLSKDTYAQFAIDVFEKFQFNVLMNHIVREVKNNSRAPVREREYDGVSWLGIQQNTLEECIQSFVPISQDNGQVGVRLLKIGDGPDAPDAPADAPADQPDSFITIWQIVMGVTEDKMPGHVVKGKAAGTGCYIYQTINAQIMVIQPSDFIYIRA